MSFRAGMCSRTAGTKGVDTVVELSETFASAGDVLIDASFAWAVDGPRDGPDVITDRPRPAPTAKTSKLIAVFSRSCRPIRDTLFFMTRPPPHGLSLLEATLCPKGGSQNHNCSRWPDVYTNEPTVESEADQPKVRSVTRWGIRCAGRQRDLGTVGTVTTRPRITRRDIAPELGRHATVDRQRRCHHAVDKCPALSGRVMTAPSRGAPAGAGSLPRCRPNGGAESTVSV